MQNNCNWIVPTWPAPPQIKALTTTRERGNSLAPFDSFNLALHVNDDPKIVEANCAQLAKDAHLPAPPVWLTQVHGTTILNISQWQIPYPLLEADGSVSFEPDQVCAVLTADCLPVLLCNQKGDRISAVHAGWRGLAAGVIEAAVQKLDCAPATLLAWLGPAIGPKAFEVKEDVLTAFQHYPENAFVPTGKGSWFADLYQLAKERLKGVGVQQIFGGEFCTYHDTGRFYSFRRSKETGRMASLIWITPS